MHLRGKAFRYEATYPDGKKEVLLDVPRYDFGWQTNYRFAEPKFMAGGHADGLLRPSLTTPTEKLEQSRSQGAGPLRRPDLRGNDDRLLQLLRRTKTACIRNWPPSRCRGWTSST